MFSWFRSLWGRLKRVVFPAETVRRVFSVSTVTSREMEQGINLWYALYINRPPWETCDVCPVGLPGAIARELARAALSEFSLLLEGSPRAAFLQEQLAGARANAIPTALEIGLALGGVALRPCLSGGRLVVDFTGPTGFSPTAFDLSGRAMGGVFRNTEKVEDQYYTRFESHGFAVAEDGEPVYIIKNAVYRTDEQGNPQGEALPLGTVPQWEGLLEEVRIAHLERPLFAYFKRPAANTTDFGSPLGTSVFAGAAALIRQADEQWGRLMWEYQSGERKIFLDGRTTDESMMHSRLFVKGMFSPEGDFFETFSPELRGDALYQGFQRILQRIEFETGLAFGDISDPQSVEKTATEIRSSKHRKYVTVSAIQTALQEALDGLVYAMNAWCDLYALAPAGEVTATFSWGDSVLDDPDSRRQDMAVDMQMVSAGLMNDFEYRMKWFSESEEEARTNLPRMDGLTTEPQNEIE